MARLNYWLGTGMQFKDIRYTKGLTRCPHSPSYGKVKPNGIIIIKQHAVSKQQELAVAHGQSCTTRVIKGTRGLCDTLSNTDTSGIAGRCTDCVHQ